MPNFKLKTSERTHGGRKTISKMYNKGNFVRESAEPFNGKVHFRLVWKR